MSSQARLRLAQLLHVAQGRSADARLDAEYIICFGLGIKKRMDLYLNFDKPLSAAELDKLRPLVARRANREPLQHIVGDTSFRGHTIKCDMRALVPRPETEELVDMAKKRLASVATPFIVEIGTGTGAIAIACAKEIPGAKVLATDVSAEALALAKENADANETPIEFAQGDLLDAVTGEAMAKAAGDASAKIDSLIANLPYIPDGEKGKLQPEVDKFDPELALYGGPDGLSLVRKMLKQTEGRLSAGASILLEIGSEQASVLESEAASYPWLEFTGIHKDFCGNVRFVSYKAK